MWAYISAFKKMWRSIWGTDFLIMVVAIVAAVVFVFTIIIRRDADKEIEKGKRNDKINGLMLSCNNFYLTLVSLFPLLGMLGTVVGLLGLDMASNDINNIKNNFFIALTSTAWGIVFSVIGKLAYALVEVRIEQTIEKIKALNEKINEGSK